MVISGSMLWRSSTSDCIICYDSAHYLVSRCFPYTGARVYLHGCFMRFQNYSFFDEYFGPNDTAVCGNTTRKSNPFQDSVTQAVLKSVTDALTNVDYFAREVTVSANGNESVYVMAQCWKTLNSSSCRSCLDTASNLMMQCLPWSEGRALNTGCFMRYSDVNFLNPVASRRSNRGFRSISIHFQNGIPMTGMKSKFLSLETYLSFHNHYEILILHIVRTLFLVTYESRRVVLDGCYGPKVKDKGCWVYVVVLCGRRMD